MADNSSIPVASGNETFANKDIGGVKFPKNIQYDSSGAEVVPATAAQIGEVQASPTANTVLDRLKAIATALAGTLTVATHAVTQSGSWVLSAGSALIGKVGIDQTTDGTTNKVAADLRVAGSAIATGSGANGSTVPRVALATDSPGVIPTVTSDQAANYAAPAMRTVPQEVHIGEVGGKTKLFPVTLSLDTNAYASGDVLADTQVLTGLFRKTDGTGLLQSIQVIDQDDQKQAIDFYFLTANNSLGTENSAPSISEANAVELVGPFSIAAADYQDLGGVSVAKLSGLSQAISAASGTADGYIAAVCKSGTPTYTASGIKLRLGVLLD